MKGFPRPLAALMPLQTGGFWDELRTIQGELRHCTLHRNRERQRLAPVRAKADISYMRDQLSAAFAGRKSMGTPAHRVMLLIRKLADLASGGS